MQQVLAIIRKKLPGGTFLLKLGADFMTVLVLNMLPKDTWNVGECWLPTNFQNLCRLYFVKKTQEEQIVYFHQNSRLNFRTCENDDRIKLWLNDKAQKFVNYLSILFCF